MYRIPSRKDRLRQMGCSRTLRHRAARPPEFGDVYPVSGRFLHTNFWSRTLARTVHEAVCSMDSGHTAPQDDSISVTILG